jgi:hypothetical protein
MFDNDYKPQWSEQVVDRDPVLDPPMQFALTPAVRQGIPLTRIQSMVLKK